MRVRRRPTLVLVVLGLLANAAPLAHAADRTVGPYDIVDFDSETITLEILEPDDAFVWRNADPEAPGRAVLRDANGTTVRDMPLRLWGVAGIHAHPGPHALTLSGNGTFVMASLEMYRTADTRSHSVPITTERAFLISLGRPIHYLCVHSDAPIRLEVAYDELAGRMTTNASQVHQFDVSRHWNHLVLSMQSDAPTDATIQTSADRCHDGPSTSLVGWHLPITGETRLVDPLLVGITVIAAITLFLLLRRDRKPPPLAVPA